MYVVNEKERKTKDLYSRKADQTRIRQELQTLGQDFENKTQGLSVDAKWVSFESAMQNIINNCIPHKLSSSRYNLPWFTRSLRRQVRNKQKLYNKAKASLVMNLVGKDSEKLSKV